MIFQLSLKFYFSLISGVWFCVLLWFDRNQSLKLQECMYMWGEDVRIIKQVLQKCNVLARNLASLLKQENEFWNCIKCHNIFNIFMLCGLVSLKYHFASGHGQLFHQEFSNPSSQNWAFLITRSTIVLTLTLKTVAPACEFILWFSTSLTQLCCIVSYHLILLRCMVKLILMSSVLVLYYVILFI